MALSNFLYHTQDPTPEGWIKRVKYPCSYNADFLDFVLPRAGIDKSKEIDPIIDECKSLFYGNATHPGYPQENFYER